MFPALLLGAAVAAIPVREVVKRYRAKRELAKFVAGLSDTEIKLLSNVVDRGLTTLTSLSDADKKLMQTSALGWFFQPADDWRKTARNALFQKSRVGRLSYLGDARRMKV